MISTQSLSIKADDIGLDNQWSVVENFRMDDTELTSVPACPFGLSDFGDVSLDHPNILVRHRAPNAYRASEDNLVAFFRIP